MDLKKAMLVSASGLKAQGERLKVIAENVANADSLAKTPGGDPYRRKVVSFKQEIDRANELRKVKVDKTNFDRSDFELRYDPGHPAANTDGYVKMPNVKSLVEMSDMREAQRTYDANINMIDAAKNMMARTIDLLRT